MPSYLKTEVFTAIIQNVIWEGITIKKMIETVSAFLCCIVILTGCGGQFESVLPPIKEYPSPAEYELTEVFTDTLTVEKSFMGNKQGNELRLQSDSETTPGFSANESGFVTYSVGNRKITVKATLTACPLNGSGEFIASHQELPSVPNLYPGKFWIVVREIPDCLMVSKKAVVLLDDSGNALVQKLDEKGLLCDVPITVGVCSTEYYQVLSGLNDGETVVLR